MIAAVLVLMGCTTMSEVPPEGRSWVGVTSDGPAPPVVGLTASADGARVWAGQEDAVCPSGAEWLGGLGRDAVCLLPGGHAWRVTRSLRGDMVQDGGELCSAGGEQLGTSGEAAVCAVDVPGVVVTVTSLGLPDGFGTPQGGCAPGWTPSGFLDFATVCRRGGEGSVATLTRDLQGRQVWEVDDPARMCPDDSMFVGRDGEAVHCYRPGPGTVVAIGWDEHRTLAQGAPDCPRGWRSLGGRAAAAVCRLDASVPVAILGRTADGIGWPDLAAAPEPCPGGFALVGGLDQAVVCVGLGE